MKSEVFGGDLGPRNHWQGLRTHAIVPRSWRPAESGAYAGGVDWGKPSFYDSWVPEGELVAHGR